MKHLFSLISIFFVALSIFASPVATKETNETTKKSKNETISAEAFAISGVIVDLKNDETLAGASVIIEGKKYYSDLEGKFSLPYLKPGNHVLQVELISYKMSTLKLNVQENKSIKIKLSQE